MSENVVFCVSLTIVWLGIEVEVELTLIFLQNFEEIVPVPSCS